MKYSIITINYNDKVGLEKTIRSVISQTCKDYEFIVIDGGSTDGSAELIAQYAEHITYWVSERDKGIYNAMNKGIKQAKGEYLNFMNSGDAFCNSDVLENVLPSLTEDIILGCTQTGPDIIKPHTPISLYSLCIYGVSHQSAFYRRELFADQQYDESIKLSADWKFTIQHIILNQCTYRTTDVIVADFDTTGISYQNPDLVHNERRQILKELLPDPIYKDYAFFSEIRSPLLEMLPSLSRRYRMHKFVVWLVKLIMKIGPKEKKK